MDGAEIFIKFRRVAPLPKMDLASQPDENENQNCDLKGVLCRKSHEHRASRFRVGAKKKQDIMNSQMNIMTMAYNQYALYVGVQHSIRLSVLRKLVPISRYFSHENVWSTCGAGDATEDIKICFHVCTLQRTSISSFGLKYR